MISGNLLAGYQKKRKRTVYPPPWQYCRGKDKLYVSVLNSKKKNYPSSKLSKESNGCRCTTHTVKSGKISLIKLLCSSEFDLDKNRQKLFK